MPERVSRILGPGAVPGGEAFDPRNPLHVDRVAVALVLKLLREDDTSAFGLLVDLCQEKLEIVAEEAAREVGLAMPSSELVVALFSNLFVQDASRFEAVQHFLGWAGDWIRDQADAWVRDLALLDTPRPGQKRLPPEPGADGSPVDVPNRTEEQFFQHVVKICFHRLEKRDRQLLRALDVERLTIEQLADRLGVDKSQALEAMHSARLRLDAAIAKIFEDSP